MEKWEGKVQASPNLHLTLMRERLAVCRLPAGAPWPELPEDEQFCSITRAPGELSLVCSEVSVPQEAEAETGWRALRVVGPLPFELTGVLASLAVPLAEGGISIFAVSTYDTDYLLIKEETLEGALAVLREAPAVALITEE